jgi:hypothetical protein
VDPAGWSKQSMANSGVPGAICRSDDPILSDGEDFGTVCIGL